MAIIGGFLVLGAVAGLFALWLIGHRPIAYHNKTLRGAIGSATSIEISLVSPLAPDGFPLPTRGPTTISDRTEIDSFLSHFLMPVHARGTGEFHKCAGHVRILISLSNGTEHLMQYDHGIGFYPISADDDSPGFCHLHPESSEALNSYLFSLGYDDDDLGITH